MIAMLTLFLHYYIQPGLEQTFHGSRAVFSKKKKKKKWMKTLWMLRSVHFFSRKVPTHILVLASPLAISTLSVDSHKNIFFPGQCGWLYCENMDGVLVESSLI